MIMDRYNVYISGHHALADEKTNSANHNYLCNMLDSLGYTWGEVSGCYKGKPEQSIKILDVSSIPVLVGLAQSVNQECILAVRRDTKEAKLIYCDGRPDEIIGQFVPLDSYTISDGKVYVVQPYEVEHTAAHNTIRR